MDEITREREELAARYDQGIDNPLVIKPEVAEGSTCVWHQYVLRVPGRRDEFKQYLEDNGVGTIIHYPIPPHLAQAYEYLGISKGSLPITERYASEVISLPIYTGMYKEEQERVIEVINSFR